MATYTTGYAVSSGPAGVDISKSYNTPEFEVGSKVVFSDGKIFRFVSSTVAVSQGSVYSLTSAFAIGTDFTQASGGEQEKAPIALGVPQAAFSAPATGYTYRYFWVQTGGKFTYLKQCAGSVQRFPLYVSSACGALTSITSSSGSVVVNALNSTETTAIVGVSGYSVSAGAFSPVEIWIPTQVFGQ